MTISQSLAELRMSLLIDGVFITDEIDKHFTAIQDKYDELLKQQDDMSRSIKKMQKDSMQMSYRRSFR